MDNQQSTRIQAILREKTFYKYITALEQGDADTLASILYEAEQDEILERMIRDLHRSYRTAEDEVAYGQGIALMRSLLHQYEDIVGMSEQKTLSSEKVSENLKAQDASRFPLGFSMNTLFKRLKERGLNKDFVLHRLIPEHHTVKLEEKTGTGETEAIFMRLSQVLHRVFNWEPAALFGSELLPLDMTPIGMTRFKKTVKSDVQRIGAYTIYAHYLALQVLKATSNLPRKPIPTDAHIIRKEVLSTYGALTFEHVLQYVWDLGVAVLPLNDRGIFHGACWRVNYQNVIVLKQQTASTARWLFDLLHELRHAGQSPEQGQFAIIETDEMSQERQQEEELIASQFAGDVLLDGRAEELAKICAQATKGRSSHGRLELLKQIVPGVARREHVSTDALANYMAFRLSLQGENWWGAAMNLQQSQESGWKIAREQFFQRVNLQSLDELDHNLLLNALSTSEV